MADETHNGLYTRYLRLAYGPDARSNRNWDILDGRALDLARELFANIPAGGDLQGYYPDPTIRDGAVGDAQITDVSWTKITGVPASFAGVWADSGAALIPVKGDTYPVNCGPIICKYLVQADALMDGSNWGSFLAYSHSNAVAANVTLARSKSFNTVLTTGDALGHYAFSGLNLGPGSYGLGATMTAYAAQPFSGTATGSRLAFGVTALNTTTPIERLSINPDGRLRVTVDPTDALDLATKQYVDAAAGGGGGGEWTDDAANFILYTTNVRNLAFRSGGASLFLNDPLEGVTASIESSGRTTLRLSAGDATGGVVMTLGSPRVGVTASGMFVGSDTTFMDARERLDVAGGILLGVANNVTPLDGTLHYTGTKFQGRVAGAWVDIPGAGGGSGDSVWLADNYVLKPIDPLVWAVQLPPAGAFLGGASPSDCGSLKLESTAITLLCTANGSTFDVVMDGGTHILAADSTRVIVNGFLFADGIELDSTIRLGASGPAPSDGTLQYTGTKFQGRVAGAWVDIPGTGGSGTVGPNRTYRTLAGGTTVLDATAEVHYASAISNATLPLASSCPGRVYEFAPANQINLSRSGSDTIVVGTAAGVTSLAITASMRVTVISDGISAWRVIAADPALSIAGINAGGSLNGTYPNPGLASNSVNNVQISTGAVSPLKMAGAVPSGADVGKFLIYDHTNPTTQFKVSTISQDSAGTLTVTGSVLVGGAAGSNTAGTLLVGERASIVGAAGNDITIYTNANGKSQDAARPIWIFKMDSNPGDSCQLLRKATPAGGTVGLIVFDNAGNLTITGASAIKATGTTWANPSDRRLKTDITDYATGLDAILLLRPRSFIYNGRGGSTAGLRGYGFIADEMLDALPETVTTKRGKLDPDDECETDIQMLDQSNLILALVNAVQELSARVVALEAA
jgi:hypothetical protein